MYRRAESRARLITFLPKKKVRLSIDSYRYDFYFTIWQYNNIQSQIFISNNLIFLSRIWSLTIYFANSTRFTSSSRLKHLRRVKRDYKSNNLYYVYKYKQIIKINLMLHLFCMQIKINLENFFMSWWERRFFFYEHLLRYCNLSKSLSHTS